VNLHKFFGELKRRNRVSNPIHSVNPVRNSFPGFLIIFLQIDKRAAPRKYLQPPCLTT
jgi:hypothetical protein